MNIETLNNAVVLAKKLHFTRTAQELNMVQPALSQQIKQLEEELNIKLFERNKRNVELTNAGAYFTEEIEKALTLINQITERAQKIHQNEIGEIRIGFTHSVLQTILPEVISKIGQKKPHLRTILKEVNNEGQYKALISKELDVGFATNPLVPQGLKSKVLNRANFVLLLPKDNKINRDNYEDFSVFKNDNFIFPYQSDGHNYFRILESICLDAGFYPKIAHITSSASTCLKLVKAGIGVAIEPKTSLYETQVSVSVIELKEIHQKAELTMVWHDDFQERHPDLAEELLEPKNYSALT